MAVSKISDNGTNYTYTCLSSDTKPTVVNGGLLIETDTAKVYMVSGGVWTLINYPVYGEGTFTPTVTLTGAGTAPQYSTASGTYTRIGRLCFINIRLSGDGGNEGSGAGIITVSLPFTTSANQLNMTIGEGTSNNGGVEHLLYIVTQPSTSTITIKRPQSATQLVDFTGADQNNTTREINLMIKILI